MREIRITRKVTRVEWQGVYASPPLEPSHPSHLGKMAAKFRSKPSQSRHKGVTGAVTNGKTVPMIGSRIDFEEGRPAGDGQASGCDERPIMATSVSRARSSPCR